VVNEFSLGGIVQENLSSISSGNNSWPDFSYLVAELWIIGVPFLWEPQGLYQKKLCKSCIFHPNAMLM
jgi:hypothetical protein